MTKSKKQSNSGGAAKAADTFAPRRSTRAPISSNQTNGWVNTVQTFSTAVEGIFVTYLTCKNDGAYVAPQKKYVLDAPIEAADEWNIHGVFERVNGNDILTVSPTRSYAWECFVTLGNNDGGDTAESVGIHITRSFNEFAKENHELFKFPQRYRFKNTNDTSANKPPLNKFISNEDTLKVMKNFWHENTYEDIANSDTAVESFFGNNVDDLSLFRGLDQAEWESEF